MDLKPFKQDIDDLINEFAEDGSTSLAEFKTIWLLKKFSFIFEASPSTNQGFFMQSLYAHSIGYLVSTRSLSHRLGGLYCLYCLFETQPFTPNFKLYLSLGELKRLKCLVIDAKAKDIKVVSALVKSMLKRNMFLFGYVDINEGSATERVNELTDIQNACIQAAHKKLFADTRIEHFINVDVGMELDVDLLKKRSLDYATAKELAIKEADGMVDVQNIKHIVENKQLIGDMVENSAQDWEVQKALFYQQTGFGNQQSGAQHEREENGHPKRQKCSENSTGKERDDIIGQEGYRNVNEQEDNEDFSKELEDALLCLPYEYENGQAGDIE